MKLTLSAVLVVLLGATGCLNNSNRIKYHTPWGEAQGQLMRIPCPRSNTPRISYPLHIRGAIANSYAGPIAVGPLEGPVNAVFVGMDRAGSIMEVQQKANGANILLHLCKLGERDPLVTHGRNITQAHLLGRGIIIKSRTDCHGLNEVTAANLNVLFGPTHYLGQTWAPFAFTRFEDFNRHLCL